MEKDKHTQEHTEHNFNCIKCGKVLCKEVDCELVAHSPEEGVFVCPKCLINLDLKNK